MWQLVHTQKQLQRLESFIIPYNFSYSTIVVQATSTSTKDTWYRAGLLFPLFNIPGVGIVKGDSKSIKLEKQLIRIDNPGNHVYSGEFYLYHWLGDVSLKFWVNPDLIDNNVSAIPPGTFDGIENNLEGISAKIDSIDKWGI